MKRFTLFLLAFPLLLVGQSRAGDPGEIRWSCLDGEPGLIGLWVGGEYCGKLDPATGAWEFRRGTRANLRDLVNEHNPPARTGQPIASLPAPRVVANARGETVRTENFLVTAPTKADAQAFADVAEAERKKLAIRWTGKELPRWRDPCPVTVIFSGESGGGGATTFVFSDEIRRSMKIEGERGYLLANVLPHEVNHTIFADWFRRPVPRWADEGAAGTAQSPESRAEDRRKCVRILNAGDGIALSWLFKQTEYPRSAEHVTALYVQGACVVDYLVSLKDHATFMEFVGLAMAKDWNEAAKACYGFANVDALQESWVNWLRRGASTAKSAPDDCGCDPCAPGCRCGCDASAIDSPASRWGWWIVLGAVVVALCVIAFGGNRPRLGV